MILRSTNCLRYLKAISEKSCAWKHKNLLGPNRIQSKCNIALRYEYSNDSRRSKSMKMMDRQEYNQISPLVQKLMHELIELSSSESVENIEKRDRVVSKIVILEDELNDSQKFFILEEQPLLKDKSKFLNRLIYSLIDNTECLSLNHLAMLTSHINKNRTMAKENKSKFILKTAQRIFEILEKEPQIILLNNQDILASFSSLQAQPFQNTEPIYYLTIQNLLKLIHPICRIGKLLTSEKICSLVNYILAHKKNDSNLPKISQKQAFDIIKDITMNSIKSYLLSEKISEAFTQDNFYKNFDSCNTLKLSQACRFVSFVICDHNKKEQRCKDRNKYSSQKLQKIRIEKQRLEKVNLRILNEILERIGSIGKGSLSLKSCPQIQRYTGQKQNQLGDRGVASIIKSIFMSFSICKMFDESIWDRLLAAIEDNSNDRKIVWDLGYILKSLVIMLKDPNLSNHKKEEFLTQNTKSISKRIARVYHLLSYQQQEKLKKQISYKIFAQAIQPYLSSKQHQSDSISEAKSENQENQAKIASTNAIEEIDVEEQMGEQEPISLSEQNHSDGYVRILKSQFEELQFYRSIAKKIVQFQAKKSGNYINQSCKAQESNERQNVKSQASEDQEHGIQTRENKMEKDEQSRSKSISQDWNIDLESHAAKKKQEFRKNKS